jgi:alcohol dehydrogenase class IV
MKPFRYHQPTQIHFGSGKMAEAGSLVASYGKRCLIVSAPENGAFTSLYRAVQDSLTSSGVACAQYDEVIPNPTTECVCRGAKLARQLRADVVLGVGGGSSMDTAKAIAVEATHPGTCWDYLYFRPNQPDERTLPVVVITTTSGTGSQVTQVAVVTNPAEKTKSALYNDRLYPRACIVDPDLTLTLPKHIRASTGFDVFCHAFESFLHPNASAYTDLMALEALRLVLANLPAVLADPANGEARRAMAWADTLAGLCIANAGVTLPHGIGMTIGGYCPQVMHGEALAVTYPEFMRFTYPYALERFATLGRIMKPELKGASDEAAAEGSCLAVDEFLQQIGMWLSLERLGVTWEEVGAIADHSRVLPDYKNNPRLADRDEIYEILKRSYHRA